MRRVGMYAMLASLSWATFAADAALAACAKPITTQNASRAEWSELEGLKVDVSLNKNIKAVHRIAAAYGELNIDYYAVTIDSKGRSAQALSTFLRKNFNRLVFSGAKGQSFAVYSPLDDRIWSEPNPRGALATFILDTTLGQVTESGSVVVSCTSNTDWVFSTVETVDAGYHPVSGNRAFGVLENKDGSLTIFTKATDRVTNSGFAVFEPFPKGNAVWTRFLDNLEVEFKADRPRMRVQYSRRVPY